MSAVLMTVYSVVARLVEGELCAFGAVVLGLAVAVAVVAEAEVVGHRGQEVDTVANGQDVGRHGAVVVVDVGIAAAHVGGVLCTGYGAGVVVVVLKGAAIVAHAADGAVGVVFGGGHDGSDGEVVAQGAIVKACDATVP